MRYQRFETGAEALRFAIEILPRANLLGAILEANERRYWHAEIRKLYDSSNYPLPRKEPEAEPEAKIQPEQKARAEDPASAKDAASAEEGQESQSAGQSTRQGAGPGRLSFAAPPPA